MRCRALTVSLSRGGPFEELSLNRQHISPLGGPRACRALTVSSLALEAGPEDIGLDPRLHLAARRVEDLGVESHLLIDGGDERLRVHVGIGQVSAAQDGLAHHLDLRRQEGALVDQVKDLVLHPEVLQAQRRGGES